MIHLFITLFWTVLFLLLVGTPILLYKTTQIQNELRQIQTRINVMFKTRMDTLEAAERRIRADALRDMIRNGKDWIEGRTVEIEKQKRRK